MISKKTWSDFRDSGMLWWVNMLLHTFGWSIVYEFDEDKNIVDVYPARVKFRGFSEQCNDEGYMKVSRFIKDNASELLKEAEE